MPNATRTPHGGTGREPRRTGARARPAAVGGGLLTAVLAALGAFPALGTVAISTAVQVSATQGALAQGAGSGFDLDEVRRLMEELKRKADAARAGSAPDPDLGAPGERMAGDAGQADARDLDPDGLDPEKAALRDKEGEDVLEAIRRARAARDAWDDPDPVLDALPAQPPAPYNRATKPIIAPSDKGLPRPPATAEDSVVLHPDPEAAPVSPDAASRRSLGGPLPRADSGLKPRVAPAPRRVTVLLVMDVGKKGIRRWSKTADPMLCVHEYCFLSRGPDKSAVRHNRRVAFGPGIALGQRGLACRSSPACVFRNVDLGADEARLQPIDLKILRHDRREAELVRADESCRLSAEELVCDQPVIGATWRAWIVPETVAEEAGMRALKRALANGLGASAAAEARARR